MNKINSLIMALMLAGCGDKTIAVLLPGPQGDTGATGSTGATGAQGNDGYSWVFEEVTLGQESLECDLAGGTRVDVYKDLDRDEDVSEADEYQFSLSDCNNLNGSNGEPGTPGEQGPPGVAGPQGAPGATGATGLTGATGPQGAQGPSGSGSSTMPLVASSCTLIVGSSPSHYHKFGNLYDKAGCSSSDKVALQDGESIYVADLLVVVQGPTGIRLVNHN